MLSKHPKITILMPEDENGTVGIYYVDDVVDGEEILGEGGEFDQNQFYDHVMEFYKKHF